MKKRRKVGEFSTKKRRKLGEFSVPGEIIFQILKELPVKSLLRLRCVSKLWCSIIDDPVFAQSHHTRSQTRPGGCISFCNIGSQLSPLAPSLDTVSLFSHYCGKSQYVNGLFLFDNWIWNPSTRECINLPPITMNLISIDVSVPHSSLTFDKECFLGFDPSTLKYKVLARCYITIERIRRHVEGIIVCKIWTIGTNSWRDINNSDSDSIPYRMNVLVRDTDRCCVAGVIYSINSFLDNNSLVAFEVGHEKFRVMPRPEDSKDYSCNLTRVGEHLALIDEKLSTIWILEDYNKQLWNRQSLVMKYRGKPLLNDPRKYMTPLGTIHTGESLLLLIRKNKDTPKLFYYDLKSKTLRIVNVCKDNPPYVESIFRLKGCKLQLQNL